jgi:hypothetical protein
MINENVFKCENSSNNMSRRINLSFWDFLLYSGALLILGWALLKAFGVIHSPVWFEMIPYFGAGASLVGGAYKLGKIKNVIEVTEKKVDKLLVIEERFKKIENEHNLCMDGKLNIHKS